MMHKTKMQRDAEVAFWLERQAVELRAQEKAKADRITKEKKPPSEWISKSRLGNG